MTLNPPRDPTTHQLTPNATRFPSGFKGLGDYMHAQGVKFAIYTAESPTTCAGYPASAGYEELDAQTFASWGVDYLKVRRGEGVGRGEWWSRHLALGRRSKRVPPDDDERRRRPPLLCLLQVDGCGDANYYPTGYPKMGAALAASGRNISYSCSWPAYLGDDETTKPWAQIIDSGCLVSGGHHHDEWWSS